MKNISEMVDETEDKWKDEQTTRLKVPKQIQLAEILSANDTFNQQHHLRIQPFNQTDKIWIQVGEDSLILMC